MTEYEVTIKAIVNLAKEMDRLGQVENAEMLYSQALEEADRYFGPLSPITGNFLIDLLDFYDKHKNTVESTNKQRRIRNIFLTVYDTNN